MALVTPSTAQIAANIIVQLEASLSQTIPLLPKSFSRVLARVLAGVFVTLYKYAGFMLLQQFVATASMEPTTINGREIRPLVEWGRLVGVGDPKAAEQAELTCDVTVLVIGGSLAGGTQLLNASTGIVYQTTAAVLLDASTISVTVRAISDQTGGDGAGTQGNLEPGQILQFASPPASVARNATVTGTAVEGADAELEDVYRERVKVRFRRRPQGGAYADYQAWGTEVAGVRAIYPYTGDPGEVDVYVEAVEGVDGIPSGALLTAVEQSIQYDPAEFPTPTGLANRRPVSAFVNVLPITRTGFDVELAGLEVNGEVDLDAVTTSITEGLDEFFRSRAPFIVGLSAMPRQDRVTQGAVAGVVNEIADANGASVSNVFLRLSGVLITQYTLGRGETAKLGTLTPI
jgi:uncharacterized phage protein gp47/JayE